MIFEYDCPYCNKEMEGDFGDDVFCSSCEIIYETDWDYVSGENMGAWLTGIEYRKKELIGRIAYSWIKFDHNTEGNCPTEYGRYLVCRKDGKIHFETWNGTGWAYNHKVIVYYARVVSPLK